MRVPSSVPCVFYLCTGRRDIVALTAASALNQKHASQCHAAKPHYIAAAVFCAGTYSSTRAWAAQGAAREAGGPHAQCSASSGCVTAAHGPKVHRQCHSARVPHQRMSHRAGARADELVYHISGPLGQICVVVY